MLSLDEVKELGLRFYEWKTGVYSYKKDGKWTRKGKWTLVENGKPLIENVDYVRWYKKGVYWYDNINANGDEEYALIDNGVNLVKDADEVLWVDWHGEGIYSYRKNGKVFKIKIDF